MATGTRAPLSKPRISAMILEGTAAVVSVVLVLWLLLWFVPKVARKNQVAADYVQVEGVPLEDVPFQAADVRAFGGSQGTGEVTQTRSTDLVKAIREPIQSGGSPVVISISAPALGLGLDAKMGGDVSIKDVLSPWKDAQRDVVLALDMVQINTDRELGVFGNAPYAGLQGAVETSIRPARNVFILTSAAPAQKSWSADGLGRSIFAYWLGRGLAGRATGWDPEDSQNLTLAGWHRDVLHHVKAWLRNGAGPSRPRCSFRLEPLRPRAPAPHRRPDVGDPTAGGLRGRSHPTSPEPIQDQGRI